ncbi:hypothetical protein G7069_10330 [Lysobacter sp. HDW10]|uniref:hypothetical protein n=1 Tax=Lysobacter sp. HDW10 TaxID=2714936 RepID=UPI00140A4EDB|nr:hypothetical protein [Lysobacter sp. HDW10]QIK81953.1 hypothetical protein G7069_10330 [Lysobacter sp. HDW10]
MFSKSRPAGLLGHLRASAQLAVFVLFIFAMKIATTAVCAEHEYRFPDTDAVAVHTIDVKAANDGGSEKGVVNHLEACTHCACHHAPALPMAQRNLVAVYAFLSERGQVSLPTGTTPLAELRPPIV